MTNSILPIVSALETSHARFNAELFGGVLRSVPVITLQSKGRKNALGWYWPGIWQNGASTPSELNISAEDLKRDPKDVLETLLHEMAHQANHEAGIKDCSRSGVYHNKKFAQMAEKAGLATCLTLPDTKPCKRNGYAFTKLGNRALTVVESILPTVAPVLVLARSVIAKKPTKGKMLLYMCSCPVKIRSGRKDLRIHCDDCLDPFVLQSGGDTEREGDDE